MFLRELYTGPKLSVTALAYFRFSISRDVEEMMAVRGLSLTYETVLYWCLKLGRLTPTACAASRLDLVIDGIWTKCF